MAMASLDIFLRHAARFSTRYSPGIRTLAFIQQSPYCSSSPSPSPEETEPSKGTSNIKVVSYAPKPKDPDAEEKPLSRTDKDFTSLPQRDSISRPWSREETCFLKDAGPVIPSVSYGVKVAPLPEDRVVSQEEKKDEEGMKEVSEVQQNVLEASKVGQGGILGIEARRLQAQMLAREEEASIPFPKLLPIEKKEPKVSYELIDAIRQVKVNCASVVMESRIRTWMYAFNLLKRGLSSSAVETQEAKRKTKRKTLFEVVKFLPQWGIGYKLYKTHWDPNAYYKITRINLSQDGVHGKAWGVFHKNGMPTEETPHRIGGANKRVWRYIDELRIKTSDTKYQSAVEV